MMQKNLFVPVDVHKSRFQDILYYKLQQNLMPVLASSWCFQIDSGQPGRLAVDCANIESRLHKLRFAQQAQTG